MSARDDLRRLLDKAERLTETKANPRRDRREPGRLEKEKAEDELAVVLRRWLRWQSERARARLEERGQAWNKAAGTQWFEDEYWNEQSADIIAALYDLFEKAARNGVNLFEKGAGVGFDTTLANADAVRMARQRADELLRAMTDTTRKYLFQAIEKFITTPGYTIGDVMRSVDGWLFDEARARQVAVTEITRVYADGNQAAADEVQRELPDAKIVKVWYTNRDDKVCPVCGPLHNKEVPRDSGWGQNGKPDPEGIYNPPAHPNCRCWTDQFVKRL